MVESPECTRTRCHRLVLCRPWRRGRWVNRATELHCVWNWKICRMSWMLHWISNAWRWSAAWSRASRCVMRRALQWPMVKSDRKYRPPADTPGNIFRLLWPVGHSSTPAGWDIQAGGTRSFRICTRKWHNPSAQKVPSPDARSFHANNICNFNWSLTCLNEWIHFKNSPSAGNAILHLSTALRLLDDHRWIVHFVQSSGRICRRYSFLNEWLYTFLLILNFENAFLF